LKQTLAPSISFLKPAERKPLELTVWDASTIFAMLAGPDLAAVETVVKKVLQQRQRSSTGLIPTPIQLSLLKTEDADASVLWNTEIVEANVRRKCSSNLLMLC
jgi:hypothetical protein